MKTKTYITRFVTAGLLASLALPLVANATGQLTTRSATVGSSAASASTTYSIGFTLSGSQTLGSVKFEICDSPLATSACAGTGNSAGASFGVSTLSSMSLGAGWSIGSQTGASASGTSLVITHAAATLAGSATTILGSVVNPSASNTQYYLRISTYPTTNASGAATDFGGIAMDTANQIVVSGTMPESLVFCVGTSGTDCTNITGTAVNLGTFSPASTNTGTSLMSASTNAGSGYAITVNGTTLTSGSNTIPALAVQTASSVGVSQFGMNLVANTTPSVGANVSGSGSGSVTANYGTTNLFRFVTGDIVGNASVSTNANLYTSSYIVNVAGSQAAGLYTATFTYICTATF